MRQLNNILGVFIFTLLLMVTSTSAFANSSDAKGMNSEVVQDSAVIYKKNAQFYAYQNQPEKAVTYIIKYIGVSGDMTVINDHLFEPIKDTAGFVNLKNKYQLKFGFLPGIYFAVGIIGIFICVMLLFKRKSDRIGSAIVALFVLIHSVFILHLSLYVVNGQYYVPHSLFLSTSFSFLYGPLLYFYMRRAINQYEFKWRDLLHLLPSLVLVIYLLPYYTMTSFEKFMVMFDRQSFLLPGANAIITGKILSLIIYGLLILKLHKIKGVSLIKAGSSKDMWQRNMVALYFLYIISYLLYSLTITGVVALPLLFHFQILAMVALVFYVAYIAYEQPQIFKGDIKLVDPVDLFKYKKSRLTPSFSEELRDKLLALLNDEKVFKENDINLEKLSDRLETNRHNTSQVINEHFGMNFFELINMYRVNEAIEILKNDTHKNLSIIEVAYEVGFNNKVTFNKSFKKQLSQTPTQYLSSLRGVKMG